MDSPEALGFNYDRRFGVEIEINAFDRRDFKKFPLNLKSGELPQGIHYVADLVMKTLKKPVHVGKWHHTHNNYNEWIIKPDSSCGIEVCSPATKGWTGLKDIQTVITALSEDEKVPIDERCSFHVHVNVNDSVHLQVSPEGFGRRVNHERSMKLASIIAHWIKCEPVFMDSVPEDRKRSRFCQCIGMSDLFEHSTEIDPQTLIGRLGSHKYYTLNTYHLNKGKRNTIEFRIIERDGCRDAYLAKNWIRLLVHFVEMTRLLPFPNQFIKGDKWSSLLWLDPRDVMGILGFIGNEYVLSKGMEQTRNWFLARMVSNLKSDLPGVWCEEARGFAYEQVGEIITELGFTEAEMLKHLLPPDARNIANNGT